MFPRQEGLFQKTNPAKDNKLPRHQNSSDNYVFIREMFSLDIIV